MVDVVNNLRATTNPTVTDDVSSGYYKGSYWFNHATQQMWVCTVQTEGAAEWFTVGVGVGVRILAQSAVAIDNTGDTNENTLATILIPANAMGLNGRLRVTQVWSATNNANVKTARVKLGGATLATPTITSAAAMKHQVEVANRNSLSSQVSGLGGATGGWNTTSGALGAPTVNTAIDQNLIITAQLATGTDTMTLESYLVELMYGS